MQESWAQLSEGHSRNPSSACVFAKHKCQEDVGNEGFERVQDAAHPANVALALAGVPADALAKRRDDAGAKEGLPGRELVGDGEADLLVLNPLEPTGADGLDARADLVPNKQLEAGALDRRRRRRRLPWIVPVLGPVARGRRRRLRTKEKRVNCLLRWGTECEFERSAPPRLPR